MIVYARNKANFTYKIAHWKMEFVINFTTYW